MMLPDYQSLMLPVLQKVAGGPKPLREIVSEIADDLRLTAEERAQTIQSGRTPLIYNRIHWAKTYLKQAGLLDQPERGLVRITRRGTAALKQYPQRIDNKILESFPEFNAFKAKSNTIDDHNKLCNDITITQKPDAIKDHGKTTPEERIEDASAELDAALRRDLLEKILQSSASFFENLVVDLVLAMGYGGSRDETAKRLGGPGDDGVDGLIQEDRLGLDRIYLQAKRYAPDKHVGRPALQAFVGALQGQGAQKGIFLTTSDFTNDAREYIKRVGTTRIALIDGNMLTGLMIELEVGVRLTRAVKIKRVDLDYFEGEDGGVA